MHDDQAPIIIRSYDLCAALYEHVDRFPRAQRTLLGRMILYEGSGCSLCVEADALALFR